MSARIVSFPRSSRCPHSQEVVDAARLVRSIAIDVFEHNDDRHRLIGFDKAIDALPGKRENVRRYIAVYGSDPYELAVHGPLAARGGSGEVLLSDRWIQRDAEPPAGETELQDAGIKPVTP
jgi:hypothetical protein